eukprot:sb/3471550/
MKQSGILEQLGFPTIVASFLSVQDDLSGGEQEAGVVIGLMLRNHMELLNTLLDGWKVSKRVREAATHYVPRSLAPTTPAAIREYLYNEAPTNEEQRLPKFNEIKAVVIGVLARDGNKLFAEELEELRKFDLPVFPFQSEHFSRVPEFNKKRKTATEQLKEMWKINDFQLSLEDLIEELRRMA